MIISHSNDGELINKLNILSILRKNDSTRLDIQKEIGGEKDEIFKEIEDLIKEGFITEEEKGSGDYTTPFVHLSLSKSKGRVIVFVFNETNITANAINLRGNVLRFERFPKGDGYKNSIKAFYEKISREHDDVYGILIVSDDKNIIEENLFSCPVKIITAATSGAKAEVENGNYEERTYFISLSDEITAALYTDEKLISSKSFAHIKVASGTPCDCGGDGCLSALLSGRAIKKKTNIPNFKRLLSEEGGTKAISDGVDYLAFALSRAIQSVDATSVVLLGELSGISEYLYAKINNTLSISLPPDRRWIKVVKGKRENATQEGAVLFALDEFFFHTDILKVFKTLSEK